MPPGRVTMQWAGLREWGDWGGAGLGLAGVDAELFAGLFDVPASFYGETGLTGVL